MLESHKSVKENHYARHRAMLLMASILASTDTMAGICLARAVRVHVHVRACVRENMHVLDGIGSGVGAAWRWQRCRWYGGWGGVALPALSVVSADSAPSLFGAISGEGIFNDAISLVMFKTIETSSAERF